MKMFSRKHYEFLADFLKYEIEVAHSPAGYTEREQVLRGVAHLLASRLERDNAKFDRAQFLRAAGAA